MGVSNVRISIQGECPKDSLSFPRTTVRVDGRFAYQSAHATAVEAENLRRLVELLQLEIDIDSR